MRKDIIQNMKRLERNGKSLFLAYDHGLEHGPEDLPGETINPEYVFEIAEKGDFNGFIVQNGLAEKYADSYDINLIIKVNGKTNINKEAEPYSPVLCSVKKAVELGAKAIGFTIYPGSEYETEIFEEFSRIKEEAHEFSLPIIAWMYPRGKIIENDLDDKILTRAARIGLELGADMVKMKYNGNPETLKSMVKAAGKTKVLCAGGKKTDSSKEFLQSIEDANKTGIAGFAIGRNIWKHEKPVAITKAIKDIVYDNKPTFEALKRLEEE